MSDFLIWNDVSSIRRKLNGVSNKVEELVMTQAELMERCDKRLDKLDDVIDKAELLLNEILKNR